jgi:hypothetical protein
VYCTAGIIIVHQKPRTFLSAEPLVATDRMACSLCNVRAPPTVSYATDRALMWLVGAG